MWGVKGRSEGDWEESEEDWEEKGQKVFFPQNTSPAPESREGSCVWSVEGRSEGNWEEKGLFYSEFLTL